MSIRELRNRLAAWLAVPDPIVPFLEGGSLFDGTDGAEDWGERPLAWPPVKRWEEDAELP